MAEALVESVRTFSAAEVERGIPVLLARRVLLWLQRFTGSPSDGPTGFSWIGESPGVRRDTQRVVELNGLESR